MSKTLKRIHTLLVFAVAIGSLGSALRAQSGREASSAGSRLPRPQPQPLRVETLSPQLEKILVDWSQATQGIKKLEGTHRRWVYDKVFLVEKRAQGDFYYEAPDKGRIDIEPSRIGPGQQSRRVDPKTGNRYALKPDDPQRWICDGQTILQINEKAREVEEFAIPKQNQGRNIMEGPLPFLFGMPPQQAKMRYHMELVEPQTNFSHAPNAIWLKVKPRWQQDAANWQEATVILDPDNHYLPIAVQLIDPSGNLETAYTFSDMKVNQPRGVFQLFKNPFDPSLRGYKKVVKTSPQVGGQNGGPSGQQRPTAAPGVSGGNQAGRGVVPAVVNFPAKHAKERIEQAGYKVKWRKGKTAPQKPLMYVIYAQEPKPGTSLDKGDPVTLWFYDKPDAAK